MKWYVTTLSLRLTSYVCMTWNNINFVIPNATTLLLYNSHDFLSLGVKSQNLFQTDWQIRFHFRNCCHLDMRFVNNLWFVFHLKFYDWVEMYNFYLLCKYLKIGSIFWCMTINWCAIKYAKMKGLKFSNLLSKALKFENIANNIENALIQPILRTMIKLKLAETSGIDFFFWQGANIHVKTFQWDLTLKGLVAKPQKDRV